MVKLLISLFLCGSLCLGGCSLYKMEIQQGNYITQEELSQVHPGMSAGQVQDILGTPLMVDEFHKDRWDYVFYLKAPSGKTEQRSVTVFFANGVVRDIRGNNSQLPAS